MGVGDQTDIESLTLDCELKGIDGVNEVSRFFAQSQQDVCLALALRMHSGKFAGKQPESLAAQVSTDVISQLRTDKGFFANK